MKHILILTLLLTSVNTFAATPLKKGQTAPHSGILITKEEEAKIAKLKKQKEILEKLRFRQDKLIFNQMKQIDILETKLNQRKVTTLEKTLWFVGGVLATGCSVYLAGKLVK